MSDPEQFGSKGKPVTYTRALVEFYNKKNHGQIHKICGMVEHKKMRILLAKNPHNHSVYQIIEISFVLGNVYVVSKDQDKVMFYVNNYIDWDQFNPLYNPNKIEKSI